VDQTQYYVRRGTSGGQNNPANGSQRTYQRTP
jgi:hypothetical protein